MSSGGVAAVVVVSLVLAIAASSRVAAVERRGGTAGTTPPRPSPRFRLLLGGFASAGGGVAAVTVPAGVVPAAATAVCAGALAAVVDVRVRRLPNRLVLPSSGLVAGLLVLAEVRDPAGGSLTRAFVAYAVLVLVLTVVVLLRPSACGMGDVRFLGLVSLVPAYVDRLGTALPLLVTLLSAAAVSSWRVRKHPGARMPLGPLIWGAQLVSLAGTAVL